jgi:regulator of sigma D
MNKIYQTLLTKTHNQLKQIDQQLGFVVHPEILECQDVLSQILADVLTDRSTVEKKIFQSF